MINLRIQKINKFQSCEPIGSPDFKFILFIRRALCKECDVDGTGCAMRDPCFVFWAKRMIKIFVNDYVLVYEQCLRPVVLFVCDCRCIHNPHNVFVLGECEYSKTYHIHTSTQSHISCSVCMCSVWVWVPNDQNKLVKKNSKRRIECSRWMLKTEIVRRAAQREKDATFSCAPDSGVYERYDYHQ